MRQLFVKDVGVDASHCTAVCLQARPPEVLKGAEMPERVADDILVLVAAEEVSAWRRMQWRIAEVVATVEMLSGVSGMVEVVVMVVPLR